VNDTEKLDHIMAAVGRIERQMAVHEKGHEALQRTVDDHQSTLYEGPQALKVRVQAAETEVAQIRVRCQERGCERGVWAFFKPVVQDWLAWLLIGVTALLAWAAVLAQALKPG